MEIESSSYRTGQRTDESALFQPCISSKLFIGNETFDSVFSSRFNLKMRNFHINEATEAIDVDTFSHFKNEEKKILIFPYK